MPAPPPTPLPCSSGWRPSSNSIPGNLTRACVELAKDWRTDRYLRRLEAMMVVADKSTTLILSGTGDVLEPEDSADRHRLGRQLCAGRRARAAADLDLDAEEIARQAMAIAADICVFTNENVTMEFWRRAERASLAIRDQARWTRILASPIWSDP